MTQIEQEFEQSIEIALSKALKYHPKTENTLLKLKELLIVKGKEYRRNNDPYHNFNEGAKLLNVRAMHVLNFFRLKHLISIADILKDLEQGLKVSEAQVNEKYNDVLVYTLIELAYAENQKEASFQHYQTFETYLLAKHKMLKRL
jgi:hypothetical protein